MFPSILDILWTKDNNLIISSTKGIQVIEFPVSSFGDIVSSDTIEQNKQIKYGIISYNNHGIEDPHNTIYENFLNKNVAFKNKSLNSLNSSLTIDIDGDWCHSEEEESDSRYEEDDTPPTEENLEPSESPEWENNNYEKKNKKRFKKKKGERRFLQYIITTK